MQSRMLGTAGLVTSADLAFMHTKDINGINLNTFFKCQRWSPHYTAVFLREQIDAYSVT